MRVDKRRSTNYNACMRMEGNKRVEGCYHQANSTRPRNRATPQAI